MKGNSTELIPILFLEDGKEFRIVQNESRQKNIGELIGSTSLFNVGT